jgi:hypothetical protein
MILRFRSERRWLGDCQSLWYAFGFAEELRPIYARFGHALLDKDGDDRRILPIDRLPTSSIGMAPSPWPSLMWIYRNRLEPVEIVADLAALVKVSNH